MVVFGGMLYCIVLYCVVGLLTNAKDPYIFLKPVALTQVLAKHCLRGGYLNFSIMDLYGDKSHHNMMYACLQVRLVWFDVITFLVSDYALMFSLYSSLPPPSQSNTSKSIQS